MKRALRSPIASGLALLTCLTLHPALGRSTEAEEAKNLAARGKTLYATYCARCHGADGADTSYPGIKSLVDVTRRLPAAEVIAKSRGFAAVNLEGEDATALVQHLEGFRSAGYPRSELLMETGSLAMHLQDPKVRIVDLRSAAAYAQGHIPGAVQLDDAALRNAADTLTYLPAPEAFAAMMSKAGISNDTHVLAYDDQGSRSAARLWYVLNAYGHEKFSAINGGWPKWTAEARPTTNEAPRIEPTAFRPKTTPTLACTAPELLARKPGVVVLDARSPEEFTGAQKSGGSSKAGRVPGSVNVDWRENVGGPQMVFKPAAELKKLYESKGVTPDKEIVTYCASGGRAAHSLFTLKLLGYPKVRAYYGSFSDYTNRPEAPVEK